jgi:DNA processing protein
MSNERADAKGRACPEVLDPGTGDPQLQRIVDQWLSFHDVLCLRPVRAVQWLIDESGDPVRALRRANEPARLPLGGPSTRRDALARIGAVGLPYPSPRYPALLRSISDPPPLLLVRGSVEVLQRPTVAIVGARAATTYGLGVARDLAGGLARSGIVVISGLARGIDAAAHEGALEADGTTVAVQACGPDITYPPEHRVLADRIASRGAVITELPPGRAPVAAHFPLRNRLISGLSLAVVVVEARPRSGSLITARHALDQGREVLAVPGPVTAPTSAGPNALLRDGARPVIELADVLDAIGLDSAKRMSGSDRTGDPNASSPDQERILGLLREVPCTKDELLLALDWSPRRLAASLLDLQLDGRVVEDRDGRLRVAPRGVF